MKAVSLASLILVAPSLAGCTLAARPISPQPEAPMHYRLRFADGTAETNVRTVEISNDRVRVLRADGLERPLGFSEHLRDSVSTVERCSWPERGTSPHRVFTLAGGLAGTSAATYLASKHAQGNFLDSVGRHILYVPVGIVVGTALGYAIERSTEPIEEHCRTVWRRDDGPASFY